MQPFIGTQDNKVDQKGRVSVPAKFRAVLQAADPSAEGTPLVYLRPDFERGCLEGFPKSRLERISEKTGDILDFDTEDSAAAYQILADTDSFPIDGTGRILIPASFLEAAGIGDVAVFVGFGRVFQIWNPEAYARFRAQKFPARGGHG